MRPYLIALLLLLSATARSQPEDTLFDRLMHTWERFAGRHRAPGLFLHLDKSVYEHSEHIQFTAYLLGGIPDTTRLDALYVLLADPATRKLVSWERYALTRYGGTGALYIPDSLPPGKYLVLAYTGDRLEGFEQRLFRQEIVLLPDLTPPFSLKQQPDPAKLRFRVSTDYGGLAAGADFHYRLQADGRTIDSGAKKVDAFGEVALGLPAAAATETPRPAPVAQPASSRASAAPAQPRQLMLTAEVKRQDQSARFWVPVTTAPEEWSVHYYPEGGNLVAGHPSQIGVEIRDEKGNGVRTQGRVLEDGNPLATFETGGDGWGRLQVELLRGHTYSADFPDKPANVRITDSFPPVMAEGYGVTVPDGVARDSVEVRLYLPAPGLTCRVMVYNDREIVYASSVLARGTAARMVIPAKDWPAGLLTMTLFDPDGVPVAERKLYSPPPALAVSIQSDSAGYHPRSKIRLLIHTANEKGQPMAALFSLSTVLATRTRPGIDPDIRRYAAIGRYITGGLPEGDTAYDPGAVNPAGDPDGDPAIDLLLLIRGWTRYHWEEVAADSLPAPGIGAGGGTAAGTAIAAADYGYVLYRGKRPPAPVTMLVMGSGFGTFETDSAGGFRIPPATLVTDRTNDLALSLSGGDNQDNYRIVLLNRYDSVNREAAGAWYVPVPAPPVADEDNKDTSPFAHAKTLQKAIVRRAGGIPDNCEDYVCIYGILNCRNHPYGRKPVIGETVLVADGFGYGRMQRIVYTGCQIKTPPIPPFLRRIKPIRLLKDTYRNDTTPIPPSVTALNTTLHWAPLVLTDAATGNAEVSFYANDLPGEYENILQGISLRGVLSGRQSFRIIKAGE